MRGNTLLKTTLSIISLTVLALGAGAQRYDRGYSMSNSGSFVKKGTWMAGGTASYSSTLRSPTPARRSER